MNRHVETFRRDLAEFDRVIKRDRNLDGKTTYPEAVKNYLEVAYLGKPPMFKRKKKGR